VAYLRLIRFPNLLIVATTQALFCFFILKVFTSADQTPVLDALHSALLILTTMLIAAGGYVINDWYDQGIDQINKPGRMIIGNGIPKSSAFRFYLLLVFSGGIIALYLAFFVQNVGLFLLYPAAVGLLWWYSHALKRRLLSGNIVVATFTAFVPGIVWFAERDGFTQLASDYGIQMRQLFIFYMIFAFTSTLFREIIKDIEDFQGDKEDDCQTLPIVLGVDQTKWIALFVAFGLFSIISFWLISQWNQLSTLLQLASVLFLLLPNLILSVQTIRSKTKADFHRCSQWAKWWMVGGLFYLLLFLIIK
jgi:4-hydroxybenzoate polyprenyltransferase